MNDYTRWQHSDPTTPGELYDMLRWMFGLGSWDEFTAEEPWFKARGTEIGKLKRAMTARKVTISEAVLAARYCHRHRTPVLWTTEIFKHLADARREAAEFARGDIGREIEAAIGRERSLARSSSDDWVSRLTRAQGDYRREVLDAWRLSQQTQAVS
jgi:hypothetical protein